MLPRKYSELAFVFFMAFSMSMLMSAMVTFLNLGAEGFPFRWLRAWGIAFSVAFPLVMILSPICRRLVNKISAPE